MIEKMECVSNDNVTVCYDFMSEAVHVIEKNSRRRKSFGGWDNLRDLFASFWNSISDQITFDDAVNYFKPNVGNSIVNK